MGWLLATRLRTHVVKGTPGDWGLGDRRRSLALPITLSPHDPITLVSPITLKEEYPCHGNEEKEAAAGVPERPRCRPYQPMPSGTAIKTTVKMNPARSIRTDK